MMYKNIDKTLKDIRNKVAQILTKMQRGGAAHGERRYKPKEHLNSDQNPLFYLPKFVKYPLSGVAALETALTLPVVCMLIFFALELMKIHITQTAIDTICAEMTFDFIATRSWNNFTSIMEKYRPSFIPKKGADGYDVIRFTIDSYTNLEEMMVTNAHGGASVHYPDYGSSWAGFDGASPHYVAASACIPVDGIDIHCAVNCAATRNYLKANNFPYGRAFVLDATVAYPFSSSFVKKLFNGGSNSRLCSTGTTNKNTTPKGDSGKYILWARGIGVTN